MYILVIDDNESLSFGLEKLLVDAKYKVDCALTLQVAQDFIDDKNYDLIILDWMLPDGSGVDFLKKNRDKNLLTPVLLLSSKSEDFEKAEALDCGADDYMQKPFSNIELLARIRAILRREGSQKQNILTVKNLQVDLSKREVLVDDESIILSNKEFELLEFLLINSNVVLTRYQISEHLNRDFDSLKTSNVVDAHIKNLRKKLKSASGVIETVRGVGFMIKKG
jgi:DNA-binding response OmpR family regulator